MIWSVLRTDFGLLLCLDFADHAERNFEVLQSFASVVPLEVAVRELVADVDVYHGVLINNLIFNRLLCIFKLFNSMIDLPTIHNTFSVTCLCLNIIINSKLKDTHMYRI